MSENLWYFELLPEIGEHPDDPLQGVSCPVLVPVMVGNEVGETTEVHLVTPRQQLDPGFSARVIPGTRIVEVRDRLLRDWFSDDVARFRPCDPPSKAKQDRQKRAATERAASTTTAKEQ